MGIIGYFSLLEFDLVNVFSYLFFLLLYCLDVFTDEPFDIFIIHSNLIFVLLAVYFYFFLNILLRFFTTFAIVWESDYVYLGNLIRQYCCLFLLNLTLFICTGFDFFCFDDLSYIDYAIDWWFNFKIKFEFNWSFSNYIFKNYYIVLISFIHHTLYIFICCYNIFILSYIFQKIDCLCKYVEIQTEYLVKFLKKTNMWVFVRKERFFFIRDSLRFVRMFFRLLLWFDHLIWILEKIGFFKKYLNMCFRISQHLYAINRSNNLILGILSFILVSTISNIYFFQTLSYNIYFTSWMLRRFNRSCQFDKPFSGFYYVFFKRLNHLLNYFEFNNYIISPTPNYHRTWWKFRWWKKHFFKRSKKWLFHRRYEWFHWSYLRPKRSCNVQNSVWFTNHAGDQLAYRGWLYATSNERCVYLNIHAQNVKRHLYVNGLYWGFADKNPMMFVKHFNYYFSRSDKKNFQWWSSTTDIYVYPSPPICDYTPLLNKNYLFF